MAPTLTPSLGEKKEQIILEARKILNFFGANDLSLDPRLDPALTPALTPANILAPKIFLELVWLPDKLFVLLTRLALTPALTPDLTPATFLDGLDAFECLYDGP